VVSFETDALKVVGHPNKVSIEALVPPYIKAVDVLSKALRDNDAPSVVTGIGINVHAFYAMENFEARDRLGRKLAPAEGWGKWGEQLKKAQAAYPPNDPRHAGMMVISMRLPMPDNRDHGWIEVKVEPSSRVKDVAELVISVNDHYALKEGDEEAVTRNPLGLLELAEARFDASMQRSDEIIFSILEQAK
jgi:hypothetical protein